MEILLRIDPSFPPRARAWVDELPSILCKVEDHVEKRLGISSAIRTKNSVVALEVFIAHGARFSYGLLAGEFAPGDSGELLIQVSISQSGQTISNWSLARGLDSVKSGIPPWAAEHILSATLEASETQLLGPGCLRFTLGAHGELGSNPWVFRGLASTVINLLCTDGPPSEEELSLILRRHFSHNWPSRK